MEVVAAEGAAVGAEGVVVEAEGVVVVAEEVVVGAAGEEKIDLEDFERKALGSAVVVFVPVGRSAAAEV